MRCLPRLILLNLDQFKIAVPDSLVSYLAYGTLIHFQTMDVSIQDIYEVCGKPHALLIWDSSIAELTQMDREVDKVIYRIHLLFYNRNLCNT